MRQQTFFNTRALISIVSTSALHLPLRVGSAHLRVLPPLGSARFAALENLNFLGLLRYARKPYIVTLVGVHLWSRRLAGARMKTLYSDSLGSVFVAWLTSLRLKTLSNRTVLVFLSRVLVALRTKTLSFDSLRVISYTAVLADARTKTLSYDMVGPLGSIVALL